MTPVDTDRGATPRRPRHHSTNIVAPGLAGRGTASPGPWHQAERSRHRVLRQLSPRHRGVRAGPSRAGPDSSRQGESASDGRDDSGGAAGGAAAGTGDHAKRRLSDFRPAQLSVLNVLAPSTTLGRRAHARGGVRAENSQENGGLRPIGVDGNPQSQLDTRPRVVAKPPGACPRRAPIGLVTTQRVLPCLFLSCRLCVTARQTGAFRCL